VNDDRVEELLKDALRREVAAAADRLDGLEERIVSELEGRIPAFGFADRLRQVLAPTRAGRWGQLVLVGATAAAFLLVGVFIGRDLTSIGGPGGEPRGAVLRAQSENEVLFLLPALDAENVSVVGSFNEWEPTPLSDDDHDGIWTVNIPLPPGRYEYAFIIDGRWWGQDPLADEYIRSFGEYSSVRYVGGGGDGA
jgi:hypothetical protein